MPVLPSGLELAISRHALFDHGGNWFTCPDGHFWYWAPAPEMGPPPFDLWQQIDLEARHAPVPTNRDEVKRFLRVLEMRSDGMFSWRGEWLSLFPRYTNMDDHDLAAWHDWLQRPETDIFFDETIEMCKRLAEISRKASGLAVFERKQGGDGQPDRDGWITAYHRKPSDGH